MRKVFASIFIVRFYKLNIGFFLLLFFLLFGIANFRASVSFHYSLMRSAAHSYPTLLILFGVWLLYGFKCLRYMIATLEDPTNRFLAEAQATEPGKQIRLFLFVQLCVFLPALLYAVITATVAVSEGSILIAIFTLVFLIIFNWLSVVLYRWRLATYRSYFYEKWMALSIKTGFRRSVHTILLQLSITRHKLPLLIVKAISLLLLDTMVAVNSDQLRIETVYFFSLVIVAVHALLPYYFVRFLEGEFYVLRNLPYSLLTRMSIYLIAYAAILLPEFIFLLVHTKNALSFNTISSVWVLTISELCFLTALLYYPRMNVERYPLVVLSLIVLSILLLAGINCWLFAAILLVVSILLFTLLYYRYERKTEEIA